MQALSGFDHLEPASPSGEPPSVVDPNTATGGLRHFVLGLVAAVLTARLFAPAVPEDEILRAKLEHLEQHADEYDGVFLGSSRIHRGFVPDEFEDETGLRVFNCGLLYGRPHELDSLLEELLAEHDFEYVFVEVMDWAPSINADLADQERTIRWHTPRQTWSAVRTTWRAGGTLAERLGRTGEHVGHSFKRLVNFGGGIPWVRSWFDDGRRHGAWAETIARGHGFVPYEWESDPLYARERAAFLSKYVDGYRRRVANVDAANRSRGSLDRFNVRAQTEQQRMIEGHGADAVFVVPPVRRGTPDWHRLDEGVVRSLMAFNHVKRHPELYDVENRFDRRHLNTDGARAFTRLLAREFERSRRTER